LQRRSPLSSVRSLVASGFGLLVVILASSPSARPGSSWSTSPTWPTSRAFEDGIAASERRSTGEHLGLLLQRYVATGTESYVAEINDHAAAGSRA
jgi:hypothetical protein